MLTMLTGMLIVSTIMPARNFVFTLCFATYIASEHVTWLKWPLLNSGEEDKTEPVVAELGMYSKSLLDMLKPAEKADLLGKKDKEA